MNEVHWHKCGLHLTDAQGRDEKLDPALSVDGCGYEWEHERIFLSELDYATRHRCPRCGAGPWYRRVLTQTEIRRIDEELRKQRDITNVRELIDALGFDAARFERIEQRLRGR